MIIGNPGCLCLHCTTNLDIQQTKQSLLLVELMVKVLSKAQTGEYYYIFFNILPNSLEQWSTYGTECSGEAEPGILGTKILTREALWWQFQ